MKHNIAKVMFFAMLIGAIGMLSGPAVAESDRVREISGAVLMERRMERREDTLHLVYRKGDRFIETLARLTDWTEIVDQDGALLTEGDILKDSAWNLRVRYRRGVQKPPVIEEMIRLQPAPVR